MVIQFTMCGERHRQRLRVIVCLAPTNSRVKRRCHAKPPRGLRSGRESSARAPLMLVYGAPVSVAVPVAVFAPREDERPRKTSTEAGALVQLDRIEILRSNRQRHDRRALQNAPRQLDETARGDA